MVAQKAPSTGKLHMQGYVQFKKAQRYAKALEYVNSGVVNPIPTGKAFQIQRGTAKQAQEYVTMDEKKTNVDDVREFGTFDKECPAGNEPGAGKGARNDLEEAKNDILTNNLSREEVLDKYHWLYDRYKTPFESWISRSESKMPIDVNNPWDGSSEIPKWVSDVGAYLNTPGDDRKIVWIVGGGGTGKTTLVKCCHNILIKQKTVLMIKNSTMKDMAYLYAGQDVVFIEIPMNTKPEDVCYEFMEGVKDGLITSTKYVPRTWKRKMGVPPAHIVVTSNLHPTIASGFSVRGLAADRVIVIEIPS